MAKMMKIGLDLDGVIIDHTSSRIKKACELGYDLKPGETSTHIIKKILVPEHYKEQQNYVYGPASLSAPEMAGAIGHIKNLSKNHEIFVISRRNIYDGGDKLGLEWLGDKGFFEHIPKENIFFVPHDEKGAKNVVAKKLGLEIYLDDQLKILEEIPDVKTRVLFDQHNVSSPPSPYAKVINWLGFSEFVKNLK